MIEIEGGIVDS